MQYKYEIVIEPGTRVANQDSPTGAPGTLSGTVVGKGDAPGTVKVKWSDGRTFDELPQDVTVIRSKRGE